MLVEVMTYCGPKYDEAMRIKKMLELQSDKDDLVIMDRTVKPPRPIKGSVEQVVVQEAPNDYGAIQYFAVVVLMDIKDVGAQLKEWFDKLDNPITFSMNTQLDDVNKITIDDIKKRTYVVEPKDLGKKPTPPWDQTTLYNYLMNSEGRK